MSEQERCAESLPVRIHQNGTSENYSMGVRMRRSSNDSIGSSNVIEYSTVDRKGAFSCCSKNKSEKKTTADEVIQPPPRRSSEEKPPERPPKGGNGIAQERQRSQSLTSRVNHGDQQPPPRLPPRADAVNHQAPSHLFLPPKKPPLPPVPPLEVLRQKKNGQTGAQRAAPAEARTASIGSPHFQRNRNVSNDLDASEEHDSSRLCPKHPSTAVSTPTSPHLGRGAHLTAVAVPLDSPSTPETTPHQVDHLAATVPPPSPHHHQHSHRFNPSQREQPETNGGGCHTRNGCTSNRENLLQKTDAAMASLLVRLDQVAAQCSAAQVHGGGRFISEEKFQMAKEELTSQSLQLVTSSKMLVIAMSDPSLPDLPENLAICLTILRKLTELCQDLTDHTTAPLQTRNLILKVHDVTAAFRRLVASSVDRSSRRALEEHLASQAESLANVLATLLRSLRVFSP